MTAPTPSDRAEHGHSPNAERLREALGWDRLPEMTPEQQQAFDEETRRANEAARRFYGLDAA